MGRPETGGAGLAGLCLPSCSSLACLNACPSWPLGCPPACPLWSQDILALMSCSIGWLAECPGRPGCPVWLPFERWLGMDVVLVLAREDVRPDSSSSAEGSLACSATQLAIDSGSGIQGKLCTSARAYCSGVHTCIGTASACFPSHACSCTGSSIQTKSRAFL